MKNNISKFFFGIFTCFFHQGHKWSFPQDFVEEVAQKTRALEPSSPNFKEHLPCRG